MEIVEQTKLGTLSANLTSQLKQVGEKLSDKDVATAFSHAEKSRNDFASQAIVAGLMLLAKRQTFPKNGGKKKGSWNEYLEKLVSGTSDSALSEVTLETVRTAREYIALAKRLLWQIEARTWERPNNAGHFTEAQIATLQSVSTDTLLAKPESARDQIAAIVSHRSLRQLLADFRKAEQLMEDEDREAGEDPKTPPPPDPQQDFFHLLETDIETIQRRRTQPDFLKQDKATLVEYANRLKSEAEKILSIVNGEVA